MSTRWSPARTLLMSLLPGAGFLACVSATTLFADPPKEPERPNVRPKTDNMEPLRSMLEKLRKDLGPNDPAVIQLEQSLKTFSEKKPAEKPAAPVEQPLIPQVNLEPLRGDGDDFFDLAQELQQQMDFLRNAIQNRGGLQLQGGGMIGPIIIGPGGIQGQGFGDNLAARRGRFGIRIEAPSPALAAQLDLPNGQGIVCIDVPADSTAGKAGIKPFDILLEVAGKPVPSNSGEFVNQLKDVKADQAIDIVLLRKGRKETIKGVKLPEPVEPPAAVFNPREIPVRPLPPNFPIVPPNFPQVRPNLPQPFPGVVAGEQFSVQQQNNAFTVQYSKDGVKMTMTGDKEGGKPVVTSVEVEADGKVIRADSIEKLPKEYQPMAERAIKNVR